MCFVAANSCVWMWVSVCVLGVTHGACAIVHRIQTLINFPAGFEKKPIILAVGRCSGLLSTPCHLMIQIFLVCINVSRVLLSTACPTSLASEPNIRGGRSGVQMAPACGAAFGGIDNDQPEIKARQRHRARLDPIALG